MATKTWATRIEAWGLQPPSRLPALELVLAGTDWVAVDPAERSGLLPLLIPLAHDGERTLGLLRWATPEPDAPMPLVSTSGAGLHLLASSLDTWLRRELATREAKGEDLSGLLSAANHPGRLYHPGEAAASGLPLNAFLLLRVGVCPAFLAELAEAHLERGDQTAALVSAERAERSSEGWASPTAFRALLLERLGKHDQAADTARLALLNPVWTLERAFAPIARLAGWRDPITSRAYRTLAEDGTKPPLDRAAHLMDAAAVEGGVYDAIRPALAALYRAGDRPDLADFATL
jgi:hypothetical protein